MVNAVGNAIRERTQVYPPKPPAATVRRGNTKISLANNPARIATMDTFRALKNQLPAQSVNPSHRGARMNVVLVSNCEVALMWDQQQMTAAVASVDVRLGSTRNKRLVKYHSYIVMNGDPKPSPPMPVWAVGSVTSWKRCPSRAHNAPQVIFTQTY